MRKVFIFVALLLLISFTGLIKIKAQNSIFNRNSTHASYATYVFDCAGSEIELAVPNVVPSSYDSFEYYVERSAGDEIVVLIYKQLNSSPQLDAIRSFSTSGTGTIPLDILDYQTGSIQYRVGMAMNEVCTLQGSTDTTVSITITDNIKTTSDCPNGEFLQISNGRVENSRVIVDINACVDSSSRYSFIDLTDNPTSIMDEIGTGEIARELTIRKYDSPIRVIVEGYINGSMIKRYAIDLNVTTEIIESVSEDSFKGCGEMGEDEKAACIRCVGTKSNPTGAIWTELGCIDPSPAGIITRIFQIGIGIMGGVIIIRLIQISLLYLKDDAQSLEEARDMLTSLVMGLILLVGGVVLLQFVGVNILGLPEGYLGG